MKNTKLYLAYGSNLNLAQMARRCPNAKMAGKTLLEGWQLTFRTHATIEPKKGAKVPVGVWEITPECERDLDRYEGYPNYYTKETIDIVLNKQATQAIVYLMNGGRPAMPCQNYAESIWEGYKDFDLDYRYLEAAMKDTSARVRQLPPKGKHYCKYCGNLADTEHEDILCDECKTDFGHSLFSEL